MKEESMQIFAKVWKNYGSNTNKKNLNSSSKNRFMEIKSMKIKLKELL